MIKKLGVQKSQITKRKQIEMMKKLKFQALNHKYQTNPNIKIQNTKLKFMILHLEFI